jgi:hypothetical protein
VGEQVVDEVADGDHVGGGIPADIHVRSKDQSRLQLRDDEGRDARDDDEGRERGGIEEPSQPGDARTPGGRRRHAGSLATLSWRGLHGRDPTERAGGRFDALRPVQ